MCMIYKHVCIYFLASKDPPALWLKMHNFCQSCAHQSETWSHCQTESTALNGKSWIVTSETSESLHFVHVACQEPSKIPSVQVTRPAFWQVTNVHFQSLVALQSRDIKRMLMNFHAELLHRCLRMWKNMWNFHPSMIAAKKGWQIVLGRFTPEAF